MKNFYNIEKLPGKAHYTGYCAGEIYKISRFGRGWRASPPLLNAKPGHSGAIVRNTLEAISKALDYRASVLDTATIQAGKEA